MTDDQDAHQLAMKIANIYIQAENHADQAKSDIEILKRNVKFAWKTKLFSVVYFRDWSSSAEREGSYRDSKKCSCRSWTAQKEAEICPPM